MSEPQRRSSFSGAGLGATAVSAMILCCAAPALVAGGLLASLGAVIRSPVVIALGVMVVGGTVVLAVGRRRRKSGMLPAPGRSGSAPLGDDTTPAARPLR